MEHKVWQCALAVKISVHADCLRLEKFLRCAVAFLSFMGCCALSAGRGAGLIDRRHCSGPGTQMKVRVRQWACWCFGRLSRHGYTALVLHCCRGLCDSANRPSSTVSADTDAPPPGFEHVAPGTHDVAGLAANLSTVQVRRGLASMHCSHWPAPLLSATPAGQRRGRGKGWGGGEGRRRGPVFRADQAAGARGQ